MSNRLRPVLCGLALTASLGYGQELSPQRLAADTAIRNAVAAHKRGETTAAEALLRNAVFTAPAQDSARARLRLANILTSMDRKSEAAQEFRQLANLPEGVNDAARGEAALRLAYLGKDQDRGVWAERILAGQYKVSPEQLAEAHNLAATAAQDRGDLRRAIEVYESSPNIETTGSKRTHVLKELAGLYFESAKGEGKDPIAKELRPAMWERARAACQEVIEGGDSVPESHRMVAELMHMETYWFEGRYDLVRSHGDAFLTRWGTETARFQGQNQRKYLNTALTLKMQNDFVIGRLEDAEAVASKFVAERPAKGDEFPNVDSMMIGLAVLKHVANERNDSQKVEEIGWRLAEYRKDYIGVQRNLSYKRQTYLRAGSGAR